jgi:hypothetical protein
MAHHRLLGEFAPKLITLELCSGRADSLIKEIERRIDLQEQGYQAFTKLSLLLGAVRKVKFIEWWVEWVVWT